MYVTNSNSNSATTGLPSHEHLTLNCLGMKIMIYHYSSKYGKDTRYKWYFSILAFSCYTVCFFGIFQTVTNDQP